MSSIKNSIISILKKLPDNVDYEDIFEAIIVQQKIMKGLKDSSEGNYYSHEEAKEISQQWLK